MLQIINLERHSLEDEPEGKKISLEYEIYTIKTKGFTNILKPWVM